MPSRAIPIGIAVVERDGCYLVGRRGSGGPLAGRDEFPGGKCRPGESPQTCAVRECLEETGITVSADTLLLERTFAYSHADVELLVFETNEKLSAYIAYSPELRRNGELGRPLALRIEVQHARQELGLVAARKHGPGARRDSQRAARSQTQADLPFARGKLGSGADTAALGKARAVRFSTLEAICAVLQCQPGDLLGYAPDSHTTARDERSPDVDPDD